MTVELSLNFYHIPFCITDLLMKTYVISMDWFSRSGRKRKISLNFQICTYLQWLDTTVAVNALHIFLEHPLILLICNMRICDKKHKNRNAADAYCLTYQNRPHRIQQIRVEAFRFFVYSDTYWQLVVCKWENVCRD